MAVYTHLTDDEIDGFVAQYALGGVLSCKGIAEGVENSNYLLVTETGPFILTLYERRVRPADLPFFVGLMEHLAGKGVACPVPIRGRDGVALRTLAGRPAAIVSFLTGMSVTRITRGDCAELGAALAALHLAGADFGAQRRNDLSVAGWRPLFEGCCARADEVRPGLADGIAQELSDLETSWPSGLPVGVIHADLFPDNVFFRNHRLSGVIDFYFACTDVLAYDIAICLNAWCFEPDQSFNVTKAVALLAAYERVRPLSREELAALPVLARGSALRFLLTRLYDWLHTPADALVQRKDPLEYDRKLRFHRQIRGIGEYGLDPERLVSA